MATLESKAGEILEQARQEGAKAEQARILALAKLMFDEKAGSFGKIVSSGTTPEQYQIMLSAITPTSPAPKPEEEEVEG